MDGEIAHLDLHVERDGVDASNLRASTGDAFDLSNDAAANVGLKGFSSEVPESREQTNYTNSKNKQQVFPPLAAWRSNRRFTHRASTPAAD
jgi:hypothetical protein